MKEIDWTSADSVLEAADGFFSGLTETEVLITGAVVGTVLFLLTWGLWARHKNKKAASRGPGQRGKNGRGRS